ncbi:hypothetical protein REPUB_Repub09cG0123300 [Reevesia pubescens]
MFNELDGGDTYLFASGGLQIGKVDVFHLDDKTWQQAHDTCCFIMILLIQFTNEEHVFEKINILARGPLKIAKRCHGFIFNGIRFHTTDREKNRRTQNSGILVTSKTRNYSSAKDNNLIERDVDYYGVLSDIIELNYYGAFKVVLFRGDWVEVTTSRSIKKNEFGFTLVNFSHLIHTEDHLKDDPFIFPSQV